MKRLSLAIVVFFAVLIPLVSYSFRQEKVYEARSLILFALGWEFVYVPEASQAAAKAPNPGDFSGFVNAEMLLLDNPRLIRQAIEKVSLERVYPDLPNNEEGIRTAVLQMDAATSVELITGSFVVKVAVRHTDPQIAADMTNALTESFLELRRGLYADREVQSVTTRLNAARGEAAKIDAQIAEIVGVPDIGPFEALLTNATSEQARLEAELRDLMIDLVGLRQRNEALGRSLGREADRREVEVLISETEARAEFVREERDANSELVNKYSAIMPELRLLDQSQDRQEDRVAELELRLRDAQATATSGFDNVRVIEPGVPPLRSVSLSLKAQLAIAIAVALLAAAAAYAIAVLFKSGGTDDYETEAVEDAQPAPQSKSKIWIGSKRDQRRSVSQDAPSGAPWPAQ